MPALLARPSLSPLAALLSLPTHRYRRRLAMALRNGRGGARGSPATVAAGADGGRCAALLARVGAAVALLRLVPRWRSLVRLLPPAGAVACHA